MKLKTLVVSIISGFALSTAAGAATLTVDFDSGLLVGGTYQEAGFTFSSDNPGGAGLASNCPTGSPNSKCLQFNNNETITVTYSGGVFDVLGFLFNAPGNGGDITVGDGVTPELLVETQNGNAMTSAVLTGDYIGISQFTFLNTANGTGRVDNISFGVTAVPLPATAIMLLAAIGGLGAMRRRQK